MDFLKKLYYDPVSGFQSATKLYKKVREAGYKKLTLKQVQEWLNNQFTQQVHQQQVNVLSKRSKCSSRAFNI